MCNNTFIQLMISVFLCQFCFYGITLTLSLSLSCPVAADYVAVDSQLTFPSMSPLGSTQCVTITITDDVITEPEETFFVTLVPVSDFVTIGEISVSSVTVGDSDCKCALDLECASMCVMSSFSPQLSQWQWLCWKMSFMRKMVQGWCV